MEGGIVKVRSGYGRAGEVVRAESATMKGTVGQDKAKQGRAGVGCVQRQ